LTLSRLTRVVNYLSMGNFVTVTCQAVGIGETTYYKWRERAEAEMDRLAVLGVDVDELFEGFVGQDPDSPYPANHPRAGEPMDMESPEYMWDHRPEEFDPIEWPYVVFHQTTARARAMAEVRATTQIMAAGRQHWQANAWYLERSFPDRWGAVQRIQHGGDPSGEPIRTEGQTTISVSDLNASIERLMNKK
jgi:hypothetical protein